MAKLPNRRSNQIKLTVKSRWPKLPPTIQMHPAFILRRSDCVGKIGCGVQTQNSDHTTNRLNLMQSASTTTVPRRKHLDALMFGLQCVVQQNGNDSDFSELPTPTLSLRDKCTDTTTTTSEKHKSKTAQSMRAVLSSTRRFLDKMHEHSQLHHSFNHSTCRSCQGIREVRETSYRRLVRTVLLRDRDQYDTTIKMLKLLHPREEMHETMT